MSESTIVELNFLSPILILEELSLVGTILEGYFKGLGFIEIKLRRNFQSAWAEVRDANFPFELVILSWNPRSEETSKFWTYFRKQKQNIQIPTFIIALPDDIDEVKETTSQMATHYFTKPLSIDDLKKVLKASS